MPVPSPSPRAALRAGASALVCAGMLAGPVATAGAQPGPDYPSENDVTKAKSAVADQRQKVSALERRYAASAKRLERVQARAAAVAEAYNGARYELRQRTRAAREARGKAHAARAKAKKASVLLRRYAAQMYQQDGELSSLEPYVSSTGVQELVDRTSALQVVGEVRDERLRDALGASETARSMSRAAARARAQQQAAAEKAKAARDKARAAEHRAQQETRSIKAEQHRTAARLAQLRHTSVRLEQARQEGLRAEAEARRAAKRAAERAARAAARRKAARKAAARRQAAREAKQARQAAAAERSRARAAHQQASRASRSSQRSAPAPSHTSSVASAPRGGAGAVIAYARAQLGKPYVWGASGPNAFDCSGLTASAWARAGVGLGHYTGAQWSETSRVPISQLQPGDLVFYGPSGPSSDHVGLYVGGGRMIEAPHTGAVVRYSSIYRSDLLPYGGRP